MNKKTIKKVDKDKINANMKIEIDKFFWKHCGEGLEYILRIDGERCYSGKFFDELFKELKKYLRLRFKESIK